MVWESPNVDHERTHTYTPQDARWGLGRSCWGSGLLFGVKSLLEFVYCSVPVVNILKTTELFSVMWLKWGILSQQEVSQLFNK